MFFFKKSTDDKSMRNCPATLGLELPIDPLPQGEFRTLEFPNTTLYRRQNEIC